MLSEQAKAFIAEHHKAVLNTFRKNGMAQLSVIVVGPFEDGAAFTTTADRSRRIAGGAFLCWREKPGSCRRTTLTLRP